MLPNQSDQIMVLKLPENEAINENEGKEELNRHAHSKYKCLSIIIFIFAFIGSVLIGAAFAITDDIENGTIEYQYKNVTINQTYYGTNAVHCGHNMINIECANRPQDICSLWKPQQSKTLSLHRATVNPQYNIVFATIYYSCSVAVCVLLYMLIWLLWMDCNVRLEIKLHFLCCVGLIVSVTTVLFGIKLTDHTQSCQHNLGQYIQINIGQQWKYYNWTNSKFGMTLIFMMVNCGLTLVSIILLMLKIRHLNSVNKTGQFAKLAEGFRSTINQTHYDSASTAKLTLKSSNLEGIH
eukprot:241321_1